MRSSKFPKTWQLVKHLNSSIFRLCGGDTCHSCTVFKNVVDFTEMTSNERKKKKG